ncbi:MAG: hypothetical protein K2W81_00990 [Sphingomonas sp.]|uniref:hypothetical protein n=1 Tax=Sphingomonas sp. TaxID=28214 RepID=UPI0025EC91F5|nr:hypothetical protein [Sphingomonas sp.]MBY0282518.1 hypothetical protein [Sphingomonas sp.]
MNSYSESAHRSAAERFTQFTQSDDVRPILRKHSQFLKSELGQRVWQELYTLSEYLLDGEIETNYFNINVLILAISVEIEPDEFRVIAWLAVEFLRCVIFGMGDVPIADVSVWGAASKA